MQVRRAMEMANEDGLKREYMSGTLAFDVFF